jgi:hypothetical protein
VSLRTGRGGRFTALGLAAIALLGVGGFGWQVVDRRADTTTTVRMAQTARQSSERPAVVVKYEQDLAQWVSCLNDEGIMVAAPKGDETDSLYADLAQYKGQPAYERGTEACASLLPTITPALERAWGQEPRSVQPRDHVPGFTGSLNVPK